MADPMAKESSSSTMEMGTSDQVLVPKKSNTKCILFGFIAMLAAVTVVIFLVVFLSGNEGGVAEPIVSTTEGTTTVLPTSPIPPTVTAPTTTTPSTESTESPGETTVTPPVTDPSPAPLDLGEIINGTFSPTSFNATWTSGSDVLFRSENGDLVLFDIDTDSTTPLIRNTSELLQQSTRVTQLSADGNFVVLSYNVIPVYRYSFLARYAIVDIGSGNETEIVPPLQEENIGPYLQNFVWGPSGNAFAYVFQNNIYYQSGLTAELVQITTTGESDVIYHGIPDWVYEEEIFGSNNALWFSKNGSMLAYATFDDTDVRIMRVPHYGVPGSLSYQYTQHHEIRYPKPGTINPTVSVTLRDLQTGSANSYAAPTTINEPILKAVSFVTENSIALMWSDRAQTTFRVLLCTHGQAACSEIYQYTETNGWIENIPLIFNEQGNSFVTILPSSVNGVLYKQIVQISNINGQWTRQSRTNTSNTVAEILLWTPEDIIWYKATGENDSAEQHIYKVDALSNSECFTCEIRRPDGGECLYNEATISADGASIAINCAGPDVPQVYVYNTNGTIIRVWDESTSTSELLKNRVLPTTLRFSVPLGPGIANADVQLYLPEDYQNRTNVPLLVYVYGGPDTALVTRQWSISWESSLVSRWGIAVAQIDGRGSGLRGVDNMFAVNRQLGTFEIADQITATRFLQNSFSWLDANRTCIWGWSYGGYAASLALARGGDVFRCAAAVAPVVDWRFYDTIYTERYMDTPANNPVGYGAASSLLTDQVVEAYRNKSYFLIHGTADDNVHYQHAMLISRLLQRRDVYFTQMSYTDEDHGLVGVRPHLYHALEKFLEDNML